MGAQPERRSKGIVSWPEEERPRERLLSRGPQALTDAELVAILIRVGFKGTSAVELARHLLKRFGSLRAMVEARFPVESLGRQVMAVFVDIYGNEAREVIAAAHFGMANGNGATKRRTGAAR